MDADFEQLVLECNNCRLKFYANELRVEPMSGLLTCKNCMAFPGSKMTIINEKPLLKKVPPQQFELQLQKAVEKESFPVHKRKESLAPAGMQSTIVPSGYTAYVCDSCRYNFQRRNDTFSGYCPYCGKKNCKVLRKSN